MPNNGDITGNSLQNPAIGSAMTQPVPTSPTGPPPPFPSSSTTSASTPAPTPIPIRPPHNDLNDAQNISKILSSIHNGSGSTISTNHNNNHSNDKRLFVDEPLSKANHKDESSKVEDDKQHHRSKRKPKAATVVTSAPPPVVINAKPNQHKHTNGLNNSTEKPVNNCHSLLNGDSSYGVEQIAKFKQENLEVRSNAFKEVRRLGRDYRGLYQQLEKVKGTFEMRFEFMQMCIDEAQRFRRKHMANCIKEWWEKRCDEKGLELQLKE
jgi:integrator complex subunit 6